MSEHPPLPLSDKTLALLVVATVVILCGIAWVAFTSRAREQQLETVVSQNNAEIRELLEHAVSAGEKWQAIAEDLSANTPFEFAQSSTQDEFNIEFTIGGHLVYLVGPGAQAALEELK